MDNLVPKSYKEYGDYVNSFRSFHLAEDGLKPVERRLLLTAHLIARDKTVKSARVTGTCMAKFHPHSDSYGTLVQLVKQGFIEGQGNFGNNLGVDPSPAAASRYTECKIEQFTEDMAFKLIKHVNWVESELDDEPEYLPTMFPFCLMGNESTIGIGFGFRSLMPCYELEDLYKRLMWLLNGKKEEDKPTIKPKLDCKITSGDDVLEQLLTTGKAKIDLQGIISISKSTCKVTVKSWPPGRKFESILNKPAIKKSLENQDIGFIDASNGDNGTAIIFSVLKQRNRDKIFNSFVKTLKAVLKGSISYEMITVDRARNVKITSVDDMLLNTFNNYIKVNQVMLNHEIDKLNALIEEYGYLELIKAPLAEILQTYKLNKEELPKIITAISEKSQLDEEIVKEVLTKYRIQRLITISTDTAELKTKLDSTMNNLGNIDEYVLNQYNELI